MPISGPSVVTSPIPYLYYVPGKDVYIAYVTLERVTFPLGWAEGVSTFITMGSPAGVPPEFFLCTGKNQRWISSSYVPGIGCVGQFHIYR